MRSKHLYVQVYWMFVVVMAITNFMYFKVSLPLPHSHSLSVSICRSIDSITIYFPETVWMIWQNMCSLQHGVDTCLHSTQCTYLTKRLYKKTFVALHTFHFFSFHSIQLSMGQITICRSTTRLMQFWLVYRKAADIGRFDDKEKRRCKDNLYALSCTAISIAVATVASMHQWSTFIFSWGGQKLFDGRQSNLMALAKVENAVCEHFR